jgi:hypothetical protein
MPRSITPAILESVMSDLVEPDTVIIMPFKGPWGDPVVMAFDGESCVVAAATVRAEHLDPVADGMRAMLDAIRAARAA